MNGIKLISSYGEFHPVEGENLIGSYRHCAIRLEVPGLAGEAARVHRSGHTLTVTELDPDVPLRVNRRRRAAVTRQPASRDRRP